MNNRHFTPTLVDVKVEVKVMAAQVLVDQQIKINNCMIRQNTGGRGHFRGRGVQEVVDIKGNIMM